MDHRQILDEISNLQQKLDKLKELLDEVKETPQVFEVTLMLTSNPSSWGETLLCEEHIRNHFNSYMSEIEEAIRFNDNGDEIRVLSIKEVG